MELYLIRHGESEANANGTHSGWSPVNLTEKGRNQAAQARKHIEGIHFDRLFVSDILRTQQTADIIFPGVRRTFLPVAREINNTVMHGYNKEQMQAKYGDIYLECRRNFDYSPMGIDCESKAHLSGRAEELLDFATQMDENSRICVVTHAGFIMAVAGLVLGIDAHSQALLCNNASVSVFAFKYGMWRLKTWNLRPDQI
ncbi:MAG: histidine phosphatase family protein [Clostridia bacterium]|nr:histidine phosphatase family protein [Clostridia bacterium]